jgi:hypothetical protein
MVCEALMTELARETQEAARVWEGGRESSDSNLILFALSVIVFEASFFDQTDNTRNYRTKHLIFEMLRVLENIVD